MRRNVNEAINNIFNKNNGWSIDQPLFLYSLPHPQSTRCYLNFSINILSWFLNPYKFSTYFFPIISNNRETAFAGDPCASNLTNWLPIIAPEAFRQAESNVSRLDIPNPIRRGLRRFIAAIRRKYSCLTSSFTGTTTKRRYCFWSLCPCFHTACISLRSPMPMCRWLCLRQRWCWCL